MKITLPPTVLSYNSAVNASVEIAAVTWGTARILCYSL